LRGIKVGLRRILLKHLIKGDILKILLLFFLLLLIRAILIETPLILIKYLGVVIRFKGLWSRVCESFALFRISWLPFQFLLFLFTGLLFRSKLTALLLTNALDPSGPVD